MEDLFHKGESPGALDDPLVSNDNDDDRDGDGTVEVRGRPGVFKEPLIADVLAVVAVGGGGLTFNGGGRVLPFDAMLDPLLPTDVALATVGDILELNDGAVPAWM